MINYSRVIEAILTEKLLNGQIIIRATDYFSPKFIIRAVRKTYGKKIVKGNIEIALTIGKPNYAEREFIKLCQKANEPFPVKKLQLKVYNPKRKVMKK